MPPSVLAHGFGDPADLGLPVPLLFALAGGAVVGFAGLLSARSADDQHVRPVRPIRPLPAVLTRFVDHSATRAALRGISIVLLAGIILLGLLGADRADVNPAPRLVFVVFWGGLVPASLLFGPVWRLLNPLRAISAGLARISGDPDDEAVHPVPDGVGVWPAVAGLAAFTWVERVADDQPSTILLFVSLYATAQIGAALFYGRRWYACGDAFEFYSALLGRLSPLGRDASGRLGLRNPIAAISQGSHPPGMLAAVGILIGGNAFESVTESAWWGRRVLPLRDPAETLVATLVLVACVLAVTTLVRLGMPRTFLLPSFVPLVAAYAFSHHAFPLLVDVQTVLAQLSDPLGRGWDLYGMRGRGAIVYLPLWAAAGLQVLAVVGFHLVAVAAAHRSALARFDLRGARAVQFPARAVFALSAVCAVLLRTAGS